MILEALHNNLSKATNPNCWNIYLISNYHTEEPYQNFPSQLFQKLVSCKKVPKMSFRVENVWQLPNETFEEIQTVCGKMYSYAKKIHAHFELDHPDSGSVVPCLKCWQYFFFWIGFHLCKAEKSLSIMEIQEKEEEEDEKDIGREYKEKRSLLTLD